MKKIILTILLGMTGAVGASPLAQVHQLQQPTWFERDGVRQPLEAATQLRSGDRLQTGPKGKLLLKFAEGSDVEVGSGARIRLSELTLEPDATNAGSSLFRSALDVLRGAFRFTTRAAGIGRARSVDIAVGEMATIGIRGTDVWGKADPAGDFVVLIEGEIAVIREGEARLIMDKPQTIYRAPDAAVSPSVDAVDPADLQRWAQETALDAGKGIISQTGAYTVSLASMRRSEFAEELLSELRLQGYMARLQEVELDGRKWRRVVVPGFISRADADYFAAEIARIFTRLTPWVFTTQ
ncbi:MAG: SPOR domain-containing protein [Gammaproteobacteria bacterium]